MANFKKHRDVSLVLSIGLASIFFLVGVISLIEVLVLIFIGTVSGFLPDLDHSESIPNKSMFNLLTFIGLVILSIVLYGEYNIELFLLIIFSSFIFIRYILKFIYDKIVIHRGMFHSIPTGLLFSFLSIDFLYHFSDLNLDLILVIGFFIFIGYISHLLLDEIYSVDVFGFNIKTSFGTALKVFSFKYMYSSLFVYGLLFVSIYFLPDFNNIFNILLNIFEKVSNFLLK
ncbi:MAG: metal-dependent hydrolase [Patescibacteria group bacterium]|nr:metal-dependent hydrolase [Patescibacteria group bacterium]